MFFEVNYRIFYPIYHQTTANIGPERSLSLPQTKRENTPTDILSAHCRGDWIRTSDLQLPKLAR